MLALKLMLVPFFIALVALVGRRFSATLAGLLSGFPIVAGPILYFLYLDQGAEFAIRAAASAISGVIPLACFCFVYAWMATKYSWLVCETVALAAYAMLGLIVVRLADYTHSAVLATLFALIVLIFFSPKHTQTIGRTPTSNLELVVRMVASVCLVFVVTGFASILGAEYSGVLAAFPIASSVIAIFSQRFHSPYHAMESLKALKWGLFGMSAFFYAIVQLSGSLSFPVAFACSIVIACVIQAVIWAIRDRLTRRLHN